MNKINQSNTIIEYKKRSINTLIKSEKSKKKNSKNVSCEEIFTDFLESESEQSKKVELKRVSENVMKRVYPDEKIYTTEDKKERGY